MSIRIIYPTGMAAKDWCNAMSLALTDLSPLPQVYTDSQWWEWARVASARVALSRYTPPAPGRDTGNWREWAQRFIQSLNAGV